MNWDYPLGATPLDPDEAEGLIPKHIVNHGQLTNGNFRTFSMVSAGHSRGSVRTY